MRDWLWVEGERTIRTGEMRVNDRREGRGLKCVRWNEGWRGGRTDVEGWMLKTG